ncbi:MAG TPA: Rieske (2Fe-2S) protein [Pseudonocardia sp.]|jgi:hypothetical protein
MIEVTTLGSVDVQAGTEPERTGRGFASVPDLVAGWWPVASSGEVVNRPVPIRLAATSLALYRDAEGNAHAVLDRCPHRRMPLSLGRITDDGLIQCGYHGWSFDGEGGCLRIPNLRPDEQTSKRVFVDAYAVSEADGLILVHSRGKARSPLPPLLGKEPLTRTEGGQVEVRSPHSAVVAALVLNPGAALGLGPLLGSGDEVVGPEITEAPGRISVVRERLVLNSPRVTTFDPVIKRAIRVRIEVDPGTGLTLVTAERERDSEIRCLIAATPMTPYRTVVRWQLRVTGTGARAVLLAAASGWALRHRAGRTASAFETAADGTDSIRDPALELLTSTGKE